MFPIDEILFEEEQHSYTYRGRRYLSVTQVIGLSGLGDDFSMVPQDRMEYARRRGRMVHLACQYFNNGELVMDSVHDSIRGYVEAYILFRQERKLKVIAVEEKMVQPDIQLAGRPDLICFVDGRRSVIDHKTAQHMSKSAGLQTAGYKLLWNHLHGDATVLDRYGLRLEKGGLYTLFPHADPDDEAAFLDAHDHALTAVKMERWLSKYKNTMKGELCQTK